MKCERAFGLRYWAFSVRSFSRVPPGKGRLVGRQSSFPNAVPALSSSERLEDVLSWVDNHQQEECSDVYASLLRRCGVLADGKVIHDHIVKNGYYTNVFLGNLLVQMYAKCGSLDGARAVFDGLSRKNLFSWSIMITAYVRQGRDREALDLYKKMALEPDCYIFASVLGACSSLGPQALEEGKQIHAHMKRCWLKSDVYVDTALVTMYAKCGRLDDARMVFEDFKWKDAVFWNGMIVACSQQGRPREAIALYKRMESELVEPNAITYATVLSACSNLGDLEEGRAVHSQMVAKRFQPDDVVENALVNMYAKCGSIAEARKVFDQMQRRNVVSWTAMIAAYAQEGHPRVALDLYRQMGSEGVEPNGITFASVLGACSSAGMLAEGKAVHAQMNAIGYQPDRVVQNALVNMYGKCGSLDDARSVFDMMRTRDVVSWTAMISAYAFHGRSKDALELYRRMDTKPNNMTFASILGACASLGALEEGRTIHARIVADGFPTDDVVQNALVNMYAKCGCVDEARKVFNGMQFRDAVSWSAMISACVEQGLAREAIELYKNLDLEKKVKPDGFIFASVLDACSILGDLDFGKEIHARLMVTGFHADDVVQTALINMYAKGGSLLNARSVFDKMVKRDAMSWTAMVAAYTQHGLDKEAVELCRSMELDGVEATSFRYSTVLVACSHAGLVDDGRYYFVSMTRDCGVSPKVEHYVCMVDVLGRAGRLVDAEELINSMPFEPDSVAWMTLLGACRTHNDVDRGVRAAEHVFKLDTENTTPYVLLSNIYGAVGRHGDAAKVRKRMENLSKVADDTEPILSVESH